MKTLTITEARKNLGRLLVAASKGEDIGIISGANIIALRKVEVESTDYAQREYGVSAEEIARFEKELNRKYPPNRKSDDLIPVSRKDIQKLIG